MLYFRKVLTPIQYAAVFGFGVLGIFFATVLYQEIHIPYVSTQKLVLPCEDPKPGSWLEFFGEFLKFLSRTFFTIDIFSRVVEYVCASSEFLEIF